MGPIKVQVLYDFSGEPGSDELTIKEGEVLTVTRQDVGEGWWEGQNSDGKVGLFPAAYVANYNIADYWGDEEWDDDENTQSAPVNYENVPAFSSSSVAPSSRTASMTSVPKYPGADMKAAPTTRNRNLAKHGGESFILSMNSLTVPDDEIIKIVELDSIIVWERKIENYTCSVASPKKESKLKGLKSYIAYQLTPSFNNIQVSRRYKHFDWLHERLEEKYCLIPIPPLPEKTISSRYEDVFIEHRKNQLQAFVDYVCRHPILSRSPVWYHFITCTDEKLWKTGKRKAEKDELVGANFFHSVQVPEASVNSFILEQDTMNCSKFVHVTDVAVKHLMDISMDQSKKCHGPWKREFQKVGHGFYSLGQSMSCEIPHANNIHLTEALKKTGDAYNDIGKMFEEQPKLDWDPLTDMLHVYKGILNSMPDILNIHKRALQTKRECEKLAFEQKMTTENLEEANRRTDIFSYAVMAEINHFHKEGAEQVHKTVKSFLLEQINFYQMITNKLQQALNAFEQ